MNDMPTAFTQVDDADPTDDELRQCATLAEKQLLLEARIFEAEQIVKQLKAEWRAIAEEQLPAAIVAAGLSDFRLVDGRKIHTKQEVYASIPAAKKEAAFQWLRENKLDGVIKNEVVVSLGRGEDAQAAALMDYVRAMGFAPIQTESVHPQTLKALIREQLEQGVDIPLETFGAYVVTRAEVKK